MTDGGPGPGQVQHRGGDPLGQVLEQVGVGARRRRRRQQRSRPRSRPCRPGRRMHRPSRRSASMSRSTSKGWARSRSSGSTPWVPTARKARSSIRSTHETVTHRAVHKTVTHETVARRRAVIGQGSAGQVGDHGHQLPAVGSHLAVQDLLHHGDGLGTVGNHARPADVPGDHAHQPVTELLLVQQDPLPGLAANRGAGGRGPGRTVWGSSWGPKGMWAQVTPSSS